MKSRPACPGPLQVCIGLGLVAVLTGCEVSSQGSSSGGGGGGPKQVRFELGRRADLGAAAGGESLADALARDLDGDGKFEWIQAFGQSNQLRVAWGAGAPGPASSAAVQTLALPGRPLRLATGDFDGDGRLGLAVLLRMSSTSGDTQVNIYEQTGVGALGFKGSNLMSGFAVRFGAGPLLGAGNADRVVVPLPEASAVQILRLNGGQLQLENVLSFPAAGGPLDVAFLTPAQLPLGLPWPALVVSERGPAVGQARVQWFRPTGPLSYEAAGVLAGGLGLALLPEPADTDGDGRADLLVCDVLGGARGLYRCPGQAQGLGPAEWLAGATNTSDARALSLAGAPRPDIFAVEPFGLSLSRLPALPEGGFGAAETYLAPRFCLRLDRPVSPNAPCLFSVGALAAEWVHGSSQAGRPMAARGFPAGTTPVQFEVGHLDADGRIDALVLDLAGSQLVPLRGLPEQRFETLPGVPLGSTAGDTPGGFRLADLDGDGDLDAIVATYEGGRLVTFRNEGDFNWLPGPALKLPSAPIDLALLDLDQDGQLDVGVSLPLTNRLVLLRGRGDLEFEAWADIPLPKRPLAMHAVNLNGDPRPELVVSAGEADSSDPALLVFRAVEGGPFPLELAFVEPLPSVGSEISSGDLNEDGLADLLVTQGGPGILHLPVFLSTEDPTKFDLVSVPIGAQPGAARLVDLDRDGHLDLAAALQVGQLAWARGDGQGGFASQNEQPYSLPSGATSLRFVDLEQDQLPEVLSVSPLAAYLWVGRNVSQ
jgi:hypothetical protein